MSKKKADVADLIRRYVRAKEAGKRAYKRSDALMAEIVAQWPGEDVRISEKLKVKLKDNFAEKGIVWTPCAARRWELEVVDIA